jgi:putative DNA methylase
MTSPYRKKLIEVALPLAAINEAAAREKSIRHGHPSTLHLWWARRPLAACRAVLFASLVDDPDSDPAYRKADGSVDEDRAGQKRAELFDRIEELVRWENSNNPRVIDAARAEIARCVASRKIELGELTKDTIVFGDKKGQKHPKGPTSGDGTTAWEIVLMQARPEVVNAFLAEYAPPVLDPFCGGGSIPLEAQRLGLRAHASDLNPVAVLITKALIEIPPKFAGLPPVNPEARKKWGEKSKEEQQHALSQPDRLAEGYARSARDLPAGGSRATGGDVRDAVADHPSGGVDTGEHRGGLGARVDEGEGAIPVDRPGIASGSGHAPDALRRPNMVSDKRDAQAARTTGRGESNPHNSSPQASSPVTSSLPSLSSVLFSRNWQGAQGLAEDVRYYGQWMRDEAEKRIGHLYPRVKITKDMAKDRPDLQPYVGQELTVIAWLWARTVPSPNPAVGGAHVPLVRSFWLSTKKGKEAWVRPIIDRDGASWHFKVGVGKPPPDFDPSKGTKNARGASFRCILTNSPMSKDHVRREFQEHRAREKLMAVVAEGPRGRFYLSPNQEHEAIARSAEPAWKPDIDMETRSKDLISGRGYGFTKWYQLFTPRQLVALTTFSDLVQEARAKVLADALACCGAGFQPAERPCCGAGFQPAERPCCGAGFQPAERPPERLAASAPPPFLDPRDLSFVEPDCRGELPHLHKPGVTYFVTWRLADAVVVRSSGLPLPEHLRGTGGVIEPAEGVERRQEGDAGQRPAPHKNPEDIAEQSETDITLGSCILRRPEIASIVREALLHFAGERYHLHAWCVMPNHVHVVVTPLGEHTLSQITHSWKSITAKQINKTLGMSGTVWERESFDHAIRTPEHLARFVRYTRDNPVKAGLCARPEEWPFSDCGAAFQAASPAASQERRPEACTTTTDDRPLAEGGTGPQAYADAVATYLAFGVSRQANRLCTICFWDQTSQKVQQAFGRQALPMTWDFCEANPFSDSSGNWIGQLEFPAKCLDVAYTDTQGSSGQCDATAAINGIAAPMISTDPPYYDNIGYADLSDFFYVWLRRSLKNVYPSLFATALTPKAQELIASPYRHDGDRHRAQEFFESGLGKAFARMHEAHANDFPLTVYYAFKQSETDEDDIVEQAASLHRVGAAGPAAPQAAPPRASTGWETMLAGLMRSGFAVTGTWPMRTELVGNLKKNVSALASSIVLVCRPRPAHAPLATRKEFISALRQELPEALKNLQHGNIAPVDLAQSAIGPGMAVFTRYAKVIESDGSPMTVRTALGIINQVLDEVLAEQEGDFDADTRWALAWFEQFGMEEGPFGVAETLSKAKNTAINGLVEAGIVKSRGGKVRLLRRDELLGARASRPHDAAKTAAPPEWDPATDTRLTVWETTQHLIRTLETKGEKDAAALLNKLGGLGETARELAYRLYSICERKRWADEALAYNSLVIAWPELTKLARSSRNRQPSTQQEMF